MQLILVDISIIFLSLYNYLCVRQMTKPTSYTYFLLKLVTIAVSISKRLYKLKTNMLHMTCNSHVFQDSSLCLGQVTTWSLTIPTACINA